MKFINNQQHSFTQKRCIDIVPNRFVVPARVQCQKILPTWLSKIRWVVLHGTKHPILAVYREMSSLVNEEKPLKIMILGEDTTIQVVGEKGMIVHSSRVRKKDTWAVAFETSGQRKRMYELLRKWIELSHFLLSLTSYQTIARTKNSVVYKCKNDEIEPRFYALKKVNLNKFKNEITIIQKIMGIDHFLPYFAEYLCIYEENKQDSIMIAMKFYAGGSLTDRIREIGPLQESEIRIVMASLCFVLHLLHQHQILHLDVKAGNILFESSNDFNGMKLVDFGSSKMYNIENASFNDLGTYGCMAPERFDGRCGPEADVYGAGVVLYHMVVGEIPFNGDDSIQVMTKNMHGEVSFKESEWNRVSKQLRLLAECMLEKDPDKRITLDEILKLSWLYQTNNRFAIQKSVPNRIVHSDQGIAL